MCVCGCGCVSFLFRFLFCCLFNFVFVRFDGCVSIFPRDFFPNSSYSERFLGPHTKMKGSPIPDDVTLIRCAEVEVQ